MVLDTKIMRRCFTWTLDTSRKSHLRTLSDGPLSNGMDKKLLRKLLVDLIEKKYTAGDIIFHEGESGNAVYVVLEGSVKMIKESNSESKTLYALGPGFHFGGLVLINHTSRFATAVAENDALLLIMDKSYFGDLIRCNNALSARILLNLAEILSDDIHRYQPA